MTIKYQSLKGQQRVYYNAPNIEVMITGVHHAEQDKAGTVTLTYTDGTTESAECRDLQLADAPSLFAVVSCVQTRARDGLQIYSGGWPTDSAR